MGEQLLLQSLQAQKNNIDSARGGLQQLLNNLTNTLSAGSGIIGAGTNLGRGVNNLANNVMSLSRTSTSAIDAIGNFVSDRIVEASAGNVSSSGELQAVANELGNINFNN